MDVRKHVIVCGCDGSEGSQRALEWAIDEAGRRGCTLRVVTAWSWEGAEALEVMSTSTPAPAFVQARRAQDEALERALASVQESPEVERVLSRGRPSEALCLAALDAELLVLGSHGHGTVHDKLVGSTSERVIHHAPCPVVLLPDPRHVERELARAKGRRRRSTEAPTGWSAV